VLVGALISTVVLVGIRKYSKNYDTIKEYVQFYMNWQEADRQGTLDITCLILSISERSVLLSNSFLRHLGFHRLKIVYLPYRGDL